MIKNLLLFLLSLFSLTTFSQISLKGKVQERDSKQPLAYATVILTETNSNTIITGQSTDDQGVFSLSVAPGTYHLKVEFIGFKNYSYPNLQLTQKTTLPIIYLEENTESLEEVMVTAEKSTTEYKLDKRVFNVGKDILSKGGTVNDVLNNVPSVHVDPEGAISLRGNPSVRILINGKPSVLTNNNGLEQLPAESISKIEVITNPSSKYDAEGTAGILNIILKKNKKGGFGSSLQLTTGIPENHGINYNINYKKEKINLFSNLRYRHISFNGNSSLRTTNFENGNPTSFLERTTETKSTYKVFNLYLGGDYYINDHNTVTLSYYHRGNVGYRDVDYRFHYLNSSQQLTEGLHNIENYREPQKANQLELNYIKTFDKKGQKLTVNLQYEFWNDDENEWITENQIFPSQIALGTLQTKDIESSKDLLFQTDFKLPITQKSFVEVGLKGEIRNIDSDYTVWDSGTTIDRFTNFLQYNEEIYGAYVQYGNKEHKFQYLLGLRAEHSKTGSTDRKNVFTTDKTYTNLFPTVHLTYKLTSTTNLQLSYSRRIRRPRFWQLNPFGGYSDRRNYRVGNPDLNPMYTDGLELGTMKRWGKLMINPSLYFQSTTNLFETQITQDSDGALVAMPVNSGTENRTGAELALQYSPFKWLRLSSEINYFNYQQKGLYTVRDAAWSSRLNSRFTFSKFSLQTSINYQGARESGQTFTDDIYFMNIGFSKDFWKDKASLSFAMNNIFDSRITKRQIQGENYLSNSTSRRMGRNTAITFTYRFNRTKKDKDRLPD